MLDLFGNHIVGFSTRRLIYHSHFCLPSNGKELAVLFLKKYALYYAMSSVVLFFTACCMDWDLNCIWRTEPFIFRDLGSKQIFLGF